MATKRTRQTVEPDFKREAVRLVEENPTRTKASIARELGIEPHAFYEWIREARKHQQNAFPGRGNATDEVVTLRRELKLVTQERDILKNAISIFSQRPR